MTLLRFLEHKEGCMYIYFTGTYDKAKKQMRLYKRTRKPKRKGKTRSRKECMTSATENLVSVSITDDGGILSSGLLTFIVQVHNGVDEKESYDMDLLHYISETPQALFVQI